MTTGRPRSLLRGAVLSLLSHAIAIGAMTLQEPREFPPEPPEAADFRCRMREPRLAVDSIGRGADVRLWPGPAEDPPAGPDEEGWTPGRRPSGGFVPEIRNAVG